MTAAARTFTFLIPTDHALNSNKSVHYHVHAKRVREIHELVRAASGDTSRIVGPVAIEAALTWADNRRRDAPNWWPTIKAAIDQAVTLGILADDSNRYVAATTIRPMPARRDLVGFMQCQMTFTGVGE